MMDLFSSKHLSHDESPFQSLGIIGNCQTLRNLFEELNQIKDLESTILLTGESGTGKELMAKAIHMDSNRSGQAFEAINCAAIPESLLESELFGYRKGAFTDAKADRKGLFETCQKGTLFLDEVDELPLSLQVKLLRVLQEKEVKPIGTNESVKIDVRIIAASNTDLEKAMQEKLFREDLYYRLAVFPIELPALRDRRSDIPLLVKHYISFFSKNFGKQVRPLTTSQMTSIMNYTWPGNIRELRNSLERAVALTIDGSLNIKHILPRSAPPQAQSSIEPPAPEPLIAHELALYREAKSAFESQYLRNLLRASKGNISHAAKLSGSHRSDIYRLIQKHCIRVEEFKGQ